MGEKPVAPEHRWLILEHRLMVMSLAGGIIGMLVGCVTLIVTYALIVLGAAAQLHSFGITQTGMAVLVGILLTGIIYSRMRSFAASMMFGFARTLGLLPKILNLDRDDELEMARETNLWLLLGSGLFAWTGLGVFYGLTLTCTENTAFTICAWFEPGPFQELLLFLWRLQLAGFGVSGVLFLVACLVQLRNLWRDSRAQKSYHESSIFEWLQPMQVLKQDLRNDNESKEK